MNVLLALILSFALFLAISILPIPHNFKVYSVMSGSMEPGLSIGELIIVKPATDYRIGDIITFQDLSSKKPGDVITHRISETTELNGEIIFKTKGDANNDIDQLTVKKENVVGKVRFGVKYLGYLIAFVKTLPGLLLVIIIPAVIIIYEEIKKIRLEAQNIIDKRRSKKPIRKSKKINNQTE